MSIKFDRVTARRFEDEAAILLAPLAEKYGVTIQSAGGTLGIGGESFTMKTEIKVKVAEGEAPAAFVRYAPMFGIEAADYGATFTVSGKTFRLVELAPNRPTWPVIGEEVGTKKRFKFKEPVLKTLKRAA